MNSVPRVCSMRLSMTGIIVLVLISCSFGTRLETSMRAIAEVTGVKAGLCVYIGCANPRLLRELHNEQRMLVHGISREPRTVEAARAAVIASGLYGLVSIECVPDWNSLPYVDGLVNLLIIDDLDALRQEGLDMKEVARVLAPGGKLLTSVAAFSSLAASGSIGPGFAKASAAAGMTLMTRTTATGADNWTHWNHDCDGNALSLDDNIAPPTHLKWTSGGDRIDPKTGPFAGIRVIGNHMVYAHSSGTARKIVCRDAQSGVTIWENNSKDVADALGYSTQLVVDQNRAYFCGAKKGPVRVLKMSDGTLERTLTDLHR